MDKETIKSILLDHGFTIKQGEADLKPYVYKAAFELLELAAPAVQGEPVAWRYRMLSEEWEKIATIHPSTFHPDHKDLIIEPLYADPQPVVQGEPAGFVNPEFVRRLGVTFEAIVLSSEAGRDRTMPLYTAPQPAEQQPDVSGLVEALEQILGWRELRSGREFPIERIEDIARAALSAYRKGGDKA